MLRAERSGVRIPIKTRDFSLLLKVQKKPESLTFSYSMDSGVHTR